MIYIGILIYGILFFYKPFLYKLLRLFVLFVRSNNQRGQIHGKIIDDFTLSDMNSTFYLWFSRILWTGICAAILYYRIRSS